MSSTIKKIINQDILKKISSSIDNALKRYINPFDDLFSIKLGTKLEDLLKANSFGKTSYQNVKTILNDNIKRSLDDIKINGDSTEFAQEIFNGLSYGEKLDINRIAFEQGISFNELIRKNFEDYIDTQGDILTDIYDNRVKLFNDIKKLNLDEGVSVIKSDPSKLSLPDFDDVKIDEVKNNFNEIDTRFKEEKYPDDPDMDEKYADDIINQSEDLTEVDFDEFVKGTIADLPSRPRTGLTYEQLMILNQQDAIRLWQKYGYIRVLVGSAVVLGGVIIATLLTTLNNSDGEETKYYIKTMELCSNNDIKINLSDKLILCNSGTLKLNMTNNNILSPALNKIEYNISDIIYIDDYNIVIPNTNVTRINITSNYGYLTIDKSLSNELDCTKNQKEYYNNYICNRDKNCILKNNFITSEGTCNNNNNKRYFIDISSNTTGNGLTCSQVASQAGNGYNWTLDTTKNRVYTDLDCNNCGLPDQVTIGNCTNGTIQYSLGINPSPNDGDSCSSNLFPNNWSLSGNQLISLQDCSSDCILLPETTTGCISGKNTLYRGISSYPINDGESCVAVANKASPTYQWTLDTNNKRVYSETHCADCILSSVQTSSCINGEVTRTVTTIQEPLQSGKSCEATALEAFRLSDTLTNRSRLIYNSNSKSYSIKDSCSNCDLYGLEIGPCTEIGGKQSAKIKTNPTPNGASCIDVANIRFGNNNWQVAGDEIFSYADCSVNCILRNNFITPEGDCINNQKKYFMDISSHKIRSGLSCSMVGKSLNGYDWTLDISKNRIYTNLECTNCNISDNVSRGDCTNGTIQYSLSVNNSTNDGKSCLSTIPSTILNRYGNNWSLSGNELVSLKDCSSNCRLNNIITSDLCNNNKKRHYIGIESYESNNGLNCTTIANQNFSDNQWSLDAANNRVYTDTECSNCVIGTISTNNICNSNGKQRYTATITQFPNNGTSCQTVLSENRFRQISNNWQISGNQVYTDVDCSVNCILKNNFITSEGDCINNKKKYFIDISSREIGAGLTCDRVTSQSGNGYSWLLDTSKNRLYTELDCSNCNVSNNVSIGDCTNGTIQYSLAINNSPNDGTSCSSNLFPNNWSISGNQLISLQDCSSDCILLPETTTGCINGKNTLYRGITSYPINNGESCVAVANKNSSYQWSLDNMNRRVYTELNCNDCILSNITSTLCVDGKIRRTVTILQEPMSGGASCLEKALEVFSKYGITQLSQLKTDITGKIYIDQNCSNCTFKNNFMSPEGECTNNNKKYYMDVSSYENLGTNCSALAKSINGYDWSLDISKNRVYTNLECANCDIPDSVSIGDCTNGTIQYSLAINKSPNDGMSCVNKAISNFGSSYNWSLSGNELVSLKDCSSNCSLKPTMYPDNNCVNNKKRYYLDISSYESNNGLSCSTIANKNFSESQWSLDSVLNRVYTDIDCSNCVISPITTNNICNSNGKQRYTATITQFPNNGTSCQTVLSENRFRQISNNWQILGNQVYTDVDCSVNCILKNNFITSEGDCINNKKKYFIDISSKEIGTGLSCPTVASRSGNGYSWSLDISKNRVYIDLSCSNCNVSNNVSIGDCTNGTIQYSLSINNSPNDGTSCSSNLFPNNWSLSGNQLVSLQDCSSNCSLKESMYSLPNDCINNKKRYYIDISSYGSNDGLSCTSVANNSRPNNQWSLDSVLNRVYTDLDCSNCILSDNITSSDCIDNKIRRSVQIIENNNDGLGCEQVAISKFGSQYGQDGWVWDTNNNRVYKDQSCSNCDLSGLEISECKNNIVTYSAIIKESQTDGTDCTEVAKVKFPGISNNWMVSNGRVVATKSCSNCTLRSNFMISEGNCLGNKKKYFIDISSYQNLGIDCPTVAKSLNGYDWELDSTKNRVYTKLECANCDVSNHVSIGKCTNGTIQYSLGINSFGNDGDSCSSNLFPNNWSLSGNQFISLQDCSSDCSLKGSMYTLPNELCINNSKRYYIDISSYGSNNGLNCTTVANKNFTSNQWFLDSVNNRVYTNIDCTDCILSPVTSSICENGKVRKTVTILQDPTTDGISCENKALTSFGISDRSRLNYGINKTIYIEDDCKNCDLSGLEIGLCTEIGRKQSAKIKTNPTTNGIPCINIANTRFGNNNWQVSGDEIFSYADCSLNCVLRNNFITAEGDCINNKKKYFIDVSSDKVGAGLSCSQVASRAGNGYNWSLNISKNRIYTELDCSECVVSPDVVTIGNCANNGSVQYSLSVTTSSNDGISCSSNIPNNVLDTYGRDWSINATRDKLFTQKYCDIDCVLKNDIITDACMNDKRKLYIDISSYQIGNGLNCVSKAHERHGDYQWSLDINNKRLYSEVDCRDCVLSPITTSSCENGKVIHKSKIIQESNGGLSCLEVARNSFGSVYGYENWDISENLIDGRFVYKYSDCSNCELYGYNYGECINDNNTLNYGIKNNPSKFGKNCIQEANNKFSEVFPLQRYPNPFKIDISRNVVYKDISCNDCELSDITIGPCENNTQRYTVNVIKIDNGGGKPCIQLMNERFFPKYGAWNMNNLDTVNNIFYKDVSCTVPIVNCELSDVVISDCIDDVKTYSADIKNYDRVTNISSCIDVANIVSSGKWQIDSISKKIYKKEKCSVIPSGQISNFEQLIRNNKFLFLFLLLLLLLLLTYYIKKNLYCCS